MRRTPPHPMAPRALRRAPRPGGSGARVAVIDIGSSAIRLELAELLPDRALMPLESLQRAVPLGEDSFSKGRIDTRTINRAIEVLRGFQRVMEPYDVSVIRAVATSAVRDARNQDLFVERVYMATGIAVEVIGGAEGDRLLYEAVRDAFVRDGLDAIRDGLIVEVGAGSIEMSLLRDGEVVGASAFALGTIRLLQALGPERRAPEERADLIGRLVRAGLDQVEHTLPLHEAHALIVLGGEVRFAADRLVRLRSGRRAVRSLRRPAFLTFARATSRLRPEQLAQRYGLPFEECQSLAPALLTYAEIVQRTPATHLLVPSVSMRDGLLLQLAAEARGAELKELEAQVYASAESLGRRYEYDAAHAHHVADLACELFDALAFEHGLGRAERRLLRLAALLHDVGLFIASTSHHKHSEYLINASDLFGVRPAERTIVACVARYHRRALPQPSHPTFAALDRQERGIVSKLAALLRIADALDRSHAQRVHRVLPELRPDELVLRVPATEDLALERLALRAKGDLFEEVFGRSIVLQRGDGA